MIAILQQIVNGLAQTALLLAVFTGCDARPPHTTHCWATLPQDDGGYVILHAYAPPAGEDEKAREE